MHNHNMLEVNNLSKNFARTGRETEFAAVDGISFTLDAGECLGLIGESGCGKSTTARLITGLVQADAGSVLLEGEEILGRKGRRQPRRKRDFQNAPCIFMRLSDIIRKTQESGKGAWGIRCRARLRQAGRKYSDHDKNWLLR